MINDRGSKKWTAMMLPEHKKWLETYTKELKRKVRPTLDEDQIYEIQWKVKCSLDYTMEIEVLVYGVYEDRKVRGIVDKVDTQLMRIKMLLDGEEYEWIRIEDILSVEIL